MADANVTEDYLKAIYNAGEWSDDAVTVTVLANRLSLSPSSVSELVRKLTKRGLVTHARYGSVELTAQGRAIAVATVRKHRLVETFLVEYLGYEWDAVHDEAEVLEHAVSDEFVERLAERLGQPTHDPHGDPIPSADGTVPTEQHIGLDKVPAGARVRVARVWDDDSDLLRHLSEVALEIGTPVTVTAHHPSAGIIELDIDGRAVTLGTAAASHILTIDG